MNFWGKKKKKNPALEFLEVCIHLYIYIQIYPKHIIIHGVKAAEPLMGAIRKEWHPVKLEILFVLVRLL